MTTPSNSYGPPGHGAAMKTGLRLARDRRRTSPAEAVVAEIAGLLAVHLAVALVVCVILDLCGT